MGLAPPPWFGSAVGCWPARAGRLALAEDLAVQKARSRSRDAYPISENQGPWMIMAVTFMGEEAEPRPRNWFTNCAASTSCRPIPTKVKFDYGKGTVGRGIDRYGAPLKMKYQRQKVNEIAVLVGDYVTADDPDGQKVLKKLKYLTPECMSIEKLNKEGRTAAAPLSGWRWMVENKVNADKEKHRGPMGHAFVTRNPLLPDEYFRPKGIEKIVYDMNKDLKNSLLYCPGKYTVKVATYTGSLITDQNEIKAIEKGKKMPSQLEEAAPEGPQTVRGAARRAIRPTNSTIGIRASSRWAASTQSARRAKMARPKSIRRSTPSCRRSAPSGTSRRAARAAPWASRRSSTGYRWTCSRCRSKCPIGT